MKKILMSLLVIAAVTGLMGASLADFSDIETSANNYFATGGMDLKVSVEGIEYDDPDVPAVFEIDDGWPCCYKEMMVDLHNAGDHEQVAPMVHLHIKNVDCEWAMPKIPYKWIICEDLNGGPGGCIEADENTPGAKPVTEPEFVAECGGIVGEDKDGNPITVPGIGCCYGENCQLSKHVDVTIWTSPDDNGTPTGTWTEVDLSDYDADQSGMIKMDELECHQIPLALLPGCNTIWVKVVLHLQDVDEDDLIAAQVLADPGTGYGYVDATDVAEAKWDHWPTNALMYDRMNFDMAFELLQYDASMQDPPAYPGP